MKLISLILVSFLASTLFASPSSNLKVNFGKGQAVIIPSPASTLSCGQIASGKVEQTAHVGDGYFTLPAPEITWMGDAQFTDVQINAIVLKLNNQYTGEYKCIHSGTNVGLLFYQQTALGSEMVVNIWDQKLGRSAENQIMSTNALKDNHTLCDLRCGGLNLPYNSPKFTAHGIWEVHGISRQYDKMNPSKYKDYPVKVTGKFTVKNVID